jgi:hypothetical protein
MMAGLQRIEGEERTGLAMGFVWRRSGRAALATLGVSMLLAGCQSSDSANPLKSTAQLAGFATTPPESKDFVKETRRGDLTYIPVGSRVERPARKMTPQEFQAIEADLESRRLRNESAGTAARAAGSTAPPAPLKLPQ